MSQTNTKEFVKEDYKYGFSMPDTSVFKSKKGLSEDIVREISAHKSEPAWMLDFRLKAYKYFKDRPMPEWGGDLSKIDFDNIYYYIKPTEEKARSWDDLPAEIKETYDRIGVPEAEKKLLAGVGAQYDSEVIYHNIKKELGDQGVVFLDMDSGLREYPELVKEYFGKLIPANDNKFAALNSAVWSGGSFIYVPKGVKVELPLQAYFRINAANMGQFERTLIIADEGSYVHYVEGCFVAGTKVTTNPDRKNIEQIKTGDRVLTHSGTYQKVTKTQKRKYSGDLYEIEVWGDTNQKIRITENHPVLVVDRERSNERNKSWVLKWKSIKDVKEKDYLTIPISQEVSKHKYVTFKIKRATNAKKQMYEDVEKKVELTPEFARLIGYYLAEGSVDRGFYTHFSFGAHETNYIKDVQECLNKVFGVTKTYLSEHKKNHGASVVVSSVEVTRVFEYFGKGSTNKKLPHWALLLPHNLQKQLVLAYFRGDGNYYNQKNKHGKKEICRFSTVSEGLAYQIRDILLRLGVVASINRRERRHEDGRQAMYTVGIGGGELERFGEIIGLKITGTMNDKRRASMFGKNSIYAFAPIKKIVKKVVKKLPVYNFSVKNFESYVAGGVAVHNCTAPIYSTDSLHAAVVEIFVKPKARVRYTTIQNWSSNVYNLVTKRMQVEEDGIGEWVDCNLGSKLTMKYPSVILKGKRARGEVLSVAYAGKGQHQDAGGKAIHLAPDTSSRIISKSIAQHGGRTSYRGLLRVNPTAINSKAKVVCDALILDPESRSDTYPTMKILEDETQVEHEASVSKVSEEQLFYLQSRGLSAEEAEAMIINGFIEPIVKQLPLEYAVELNRLIQLQMEGSVG